jgi:hypothetical protein
VSAKHTSLIIHNITIINNLRHLWVTGLSIPYSYSHLGTQRVVSYRTTHIQHLSEHFQNHNAQNGRWVQLIPMSWRHVWIKITPKTWLSHWVYLPLPKVSTKGKVVIVYSMSLVLTYQEITISMSTSLLEGQSNKKKNISRPKTNIWNFFSKSQRQPP